MVDIWEGPKYAAEIYPKLCGIDRWPKHGITEGVFDSYQSNSSALSTTNLRMSLPSY